MRTILLFVIATAAYPQAALPDRLLQSDGEVRDLAFSAKGETVAFCADAKVRVWDTQSGKLLRTIAVAPEVRRIAFGPDANRIITSGPDTPLRISELDGPHHARELAPAAMRQGPAIFSTDGATIATTGRDKSIHVWKSSEGRDNVSIRGGLGGASAMALSPDGKFLVAADSDTNIRVWNSRNGELLRLIEELPVTTFALAFSPDGKVLASGGVDRTVYLWDSQTWKLLRKITGQPEMISSLAFSPDGRLLVTGGFSELSSKEPVSILVREVESGKIVRTIASAHRVSATEFSPDGKYVASTGRDKAVHLWRVPVRQ
jgi:WD40 repeat protein